MSNNIVNVNINIDDREFRRFMQNKYNIIDRFISLVANELLGNIKRNVPVNHGRLRSSFQLKKLSYNKYKIISGVKYAEYVDRGTGIYGPFRRPITPVRKKYLHFFIGNKEIFAKSVKGQKGVQYTDKAIEKTERRIEEFFRRALNEYIS